MGPGTQLHGQTRQGTAAHVPVAVEASPRATTSTSIPAADTLLLDPVARLRRAVEAGERTLAHDTLFGYLPAVLEALDVPASSQGLVFSRTSLQTDRIAPWSPRAVYFSDDVYVGFVQEGPIMELAAVDPDDGAVFYTLSQSPDSTPVFERETTTCLMCHASSVTGDVPGFMVLSTLTDRSGYPVSEIHEGSTDDRTPLADRWGGWYVTGRTGEMVHAGNQRSSRLLREIGTPRAALESLERAEGSNVTELGDHFYPGAYLAGGESDVVALLVLVHQAYVHNLMAQARKRTDEALADQEAVARTTGREPPEDGYLPITRARIEAVTERLLEGMLFVDAVPFTQPIEGTTDFAREFEERGPFDRRGRSLRALDLETRLFRYPLSFLVYSDAFQALPEPVLTTFHRRLAEILDGRDGSGTFDGLSAEDRAAIREILAETLPGFPADPDGGSLGGR